MELLFLGLQWVHDARDEPAARAVPHAAHHPQGDRADGADHPQEVQLDTGAAEAKYLRGGHDPQKSLPRRKVSVFYFVSIVEVVEVLAFTILGTFVLFPCFEVPSISDLETF